MNNLISIIIPVYNVEQYLVRCLNSIINQTYKELEIILIDDGSTDNSGKICDEYALKDKRIRVIHKQNGGVSSARNAGLDIATGEYIGFVDSDDYIETDMYEFLLELLVRNNMEVVSCNMFVFFKKKIATSVYFPKEGILSFCDILQYGGFGFSIFTKLFKKNLIGNIRFDEKLVIGEDSLFCFNVLKNSRYVLFKNVAKYYYFNNPNSVMRKKIFKKEFLGVLNYCDYMVKYSKEKGLHLAYRKFLRHKLMWIIELLSRIAEESSAKQNKDSVDKLLKLARKNLFNFLLLRFRISYRGFILVSCINFNLACKLYKLLNR